MSSDCSCDACGYELEIGDVKCGQCGGECDPDATRGFKIKRRLTRGNTLVIDLTAQNPWTKAAPSSGSAGFKARVTVRQNLGDPTPAFVGSFDSGDIVDLGGGQWRVTIPSDVTYALPDGVVKLYYDVQFVEDARTWTQEKGLIEVMPGVAQYFDPSAALRKTDLATFDRKHVECLTIGLTDVELYAWRDGLGNSVIPDGHALKLEASITALRTDGTAGDMFSVVAMYRRVGGTVFLVNSIVTHQGPTTWVVTPDPGAPAIDVHSAVAVNVRWAARVETTLLKGV